MNAIRQNEDAFSDHPKNNRNSQSTNYSLEDSLQIQESQNIFAQLDRQRNLLKNIWQTKVHQPNITSEMITKVVDWMFGNFWRFDMEDECIFLCLSLMQTYLKNRVIEKSKLQCLGVTSMYISSKFFQVKKLSMETILELCHQLYSQQQIVEMQFEVLSVMDFSLVLPSVDKYFQLCTRDIQLGREDKYKIKFWLQLWMLKQLLSDFSQKHIFDSVRNFVSGGVLTECVKKLIIFGQTTNYRYLLKKCMSQFDVESYLNCVQLL